MIRVLSAAGLVMMGCGAQSAQSGSFRATIDASAAPDTRFVEVYYANGEPGSTPIATPDILAGTSSLATTAMVWSGQFLVGPGYHGPVGVGGPSGDGPLYLGVIGLGGTGITGGAWSGPIAQPDGAMVELHLDPALVPEVWGTPAETGQCYRLNTGAATVYITRGDDPDCDGLIGSQDRQPHAYCDPSATSGPAHDACQ
jgi:hypothetical protein